MLTVDQDNRVFSVIQTTSAADIGTYLIAYKITVPIYPTIPSKMSEPFKIYVTQQKVDVVVERCFSFNQPFFTSELAVVSLTAS